MPDLGYFSFRDVWSPVFLLFMLAVVVLYTFAVGPWRERFAGSAPVGAKRQTAFWLGIALLYLAQGGPLSLLGHLMFSYHMGSMAISYVVVPPMLLYGIPDWMWRAAFSHRFWRPLRFLMNPLLTLGFFNIFFSFYHMPAIHDWIMTHYFVHALYYILLLVTAMMMWWHIYCPVPEWNRLTPLRVIGYIFLDSLLLTPACVLIIFAGSPLFSVYYDPHDWARAMGYCVSGDLSALLAQGGPGLFNRMSPVEDQQLGGIIMKLLQEFVNAGAMYGVFVQWYRKERAKEDDPSLQEVSAATRMNNV
jgi:putative membrane protein